MKKSFKIIGMRSYEYPGINLMMTFSTFHIQIINVQLMERDCIAAHTIVACGKHAVDPHDEGSGPLYANQSIIMDIFPRHSTSRYFADFTRTVVRGKASTKLRKMYNAVEEGQRIAFKMLRHGVDGSKVHGAIQKRFQELGFKTGVFNGRMQGFFHGTGHGLGLDIHEPPRVSLGKDILKFSAERMRRLRGKEMNMVFQEPLNAFNPVFTIGQQIDEVLLTHTDLKAKQRQSKILDLLDTVGIKDTNRVASNYPHQLSGGMRQRAMIAQTIAGNPKLIIADEPTSNLDVTLQAKIMELFVKLKEQFHLSILLITHDLGMVRHISDSIYVMRRGEVVESGLTEKIVNQPSHEYTKQLMSALEI